MDVTVVICTWNRAAMLAETLGILAAVRIPAGLEWECIVVNNNCTDRTDEVLASCAGRLPLRRLSEPVPGLARARNLAARAARGEVILFIDDDIHVDREWMAAYVDAISAWPAASYFGGKIDPLYQAQPPDFVTDNLAALAGLLGMLDLGAVARLFCGTEAPFGGNMGIRRAVFEKHEFDEHFGHRHAARMPGEETAFFDDLRRDGREGVWIPAAKVGHVIPPERLTEAEIYRHFSAYGRCVVRRGEKGRTWILGFPNWLCRAYCRLTRARIALGRAIGTTSWTPLLARCATWEGMLEEARVAPARAHKRLAEAVDE